MSAAGIVRGDIRGGMGIMEAALVVERLGSDRADIHPREIMRAIGVGRNTAYRWRNAWHDAHKTCPPALARGPKAWRFAP